MSIAAPPVPILPLESIGSSSSFGSTQLYSLRNDKPENPQIFEIDCQALPLHSCRQQYRHSRIQQVHETEVTLSSHKEANEFLEAIGYHYKNYFEKERITYSLDDHEIDIDTWPNIPTYFEIEGEDEEDIERVLKKIGYTMKDTISCTSNKVFEIYGKSMFEKKELMFNDERLYQNN
jgi:adenylate cyclase class 2